MRAVRVSLMLVNDLRQLEAFRILARSGSFTDTAKRMGVTQSAISHSLKNLESSINCKLFNRSGRKLILTDRGRELLNEIEGSLNQINNALEHASTPAKWGIGTLRIGIEHLLAKHLVRDILIELDSLFPFLRCEITTEYTPNLLDLLDRDQLDIVAGIQSPGSPSPENATRHFTPVAEESLLLFLPADHSALHGKPFLWEKQKSIVIMTCGRDEEDYIHSYLSHFTEAPSVHHHITSENAFRELILSGLGVGIGSPWMLKNQLTKDKIGTIPVPSQGLKRQWTIFSNSNNPTPASVSFETLFKRGFENLSA
ncbi:MAG: LysR family transcriptional regulator [Verrucomicrobiota bacterium]